MTEASDLAAAGWKCLEGVGFTGGAGPFWTRGTGAALEMGFLAEPKHSNNSPGSVHGGMLMTFADIGLGYSAAHAVGHPRMVTAQLQIQFLSTAKVGEFVFCQPEVVRKGKQLVFVRGLICADGKTVASADGIWKLLEKKGG